MKALALLLIMITLKPAAYAWDHSGYEYLFPERVLDLECHTDKEGTIIKYSGKKSECPNTSYECMPMVNVKTGDTIKLDSQNFTTYLTQFEGPNGVNTREIESELGMLYAQIWAYGSSSQTNALDLYIDMKTCEVKFASGNVKIQNKIKCSLTYPTDGYYYFQFQKPDGWHGVTGIYGQSPCIKILNK